jgi:hypothetical protein
VPALVVCAARTWKWCRVGKMAKGAGQVRFQGAPSGWNQRLAAPAFVMRVCLREIEMFYITHISGARATVSGKAPRFCSRDCQPPHAMKPPFEFFLMTRTYNSYGGHHTLSLIPGYILADAPCFGAAINELTVTFHFPHSGPPRNTIEQLYATFHANRLKLPKVIFRRSRERAAIDIASNLIDGSDLEKRGGLSLCLFKGGFTETVASLDLLRPRLTPKDDFSLDAFISHCKQRETTLPDSDEALRNLKTALDAKQAAIRAAMSPWERLNIEWRDFHSDARRILGDPFFWEQANDFSPHGNDTGADLLTEYRHWLSSHPADDPLVFYEYLMARWGFSPKAADPTIRSAMDEAAVALAFAELKLRAHCRASALTLAEAAVQRQRQEALLATEWSHRQDRLRSLELIEAKLQASA